MLLTIAFPPRAAYLGLIRFRQPETIAMATDNLDKLVASGIPLHKAIAMGMAEGSSGQDDAGVTTGPKAVAEMKAIEKEAVKEDMGMPEKMPGMGSMMSDKY